MANQCYNLVDQARAAEQYRIRYAVGLADAAKGAETIPSIRAVTFADTPRARDDYSGWSVRILYEAMRAAEAWTPATAHVATMADAAHGREALSAVSHLLLGDAARTAETWTLASRVAYSDPIQAEEAWHPYLIAAARLSDFARAGESYTGLGLLPLADAAVCAERYTRVLAVTLGDAARAAEAWMTGAATSALLHDHARAREGYTLAQRHFAALREKGWADEVYTPPACADDADGWTANTDTFAMSRYTHWPVDSLAVIGETLYGAAADGLHVLEGNDDAGQPIDARIQTGLDGFGNEFVKHPRMIYAWAEVAPPGQLFVTVHHTTNGGGADFTYRFEPRGAHDFAPQRAALGRGLKSRYFAFTIGNRHGAKFSLDAASVIADSTSRRV